MELNISIRQGSVAMQFRSLAWDANNGLASFEYEPSFLTNNWDISPLKMPIDGAERRVFLFPN
jgi:serine/threonine-protein kinase HipA